MSQALKLALSPLLLAQALHARRAIFKLPEAAGPRRGSLGHGAAALRLLIVGDSSAAGVGVEHQDQALSGRLSHALAHTLGQRVQWQLCARSGINSLQASGLLDDADAADVAVVVTGVNDVVDQLRPARALAARAQLLQALRQRCAIRHTVMTAVPPMQGFAGLPQPLRWMAGRDAAAHDAALAAWAAAQADVSHLPFKLPLDDVRLLASDGFHPGAPLYLLWGEALAWHIASQVWPRLSGR